MQCTSRSLLETGETVQPVATLSAISALSDQLLGIAHDKTRRIQQINTQTKILALNALIEACHAGDQGHGFSVVAQEMRAIGTGVETLSRELEMQLTRRIGELQQMVSAMAVKAQDDRLVDLALNAVELIDRNLYERTCDVRWWATDASLTACAETPGEGAMAHASQRLGVILSAYTVYLDLWLCNMEGRVLANGRPDRYPEVRGRSVTNEPWFREACGLASGDAYVCADVRREPGLGGAQVATYAASVREGGQVNARPTGVLAIHFDWEPQARAIVEGVRVAPEDRHRTRVLLVDAQRRVLAASDKQGAFTETVAFDPAGRQTGVERNAFSDKITAYHRTPGYETYLGQGWFGVIVQRMP